MSSKIKRAVSFLLLVFSAFGVTISGPLILGWMTVTAPFFDLGPTASLIGGYLDIIGGILQIILLGYMVTKGVFSANSDKNNSKKLYKLMAATCIIGLIGDPLGGLLAIAAQIGLYTSLVNIYLLRK